MAKPARDAGEVGMATRKPLDSIYPTGYFVPEKPVNKGEQRGRAEGPDRHVEGAERGVDPAVFVPDIYRGGLGSDHPFVPDSALSNSGARRCRRGAVAGLAGTAAAGVAHHLRHDLRLPAVGAVRDSRGHADRGLEDGGKLRLSAAGVLAVGAEDRDRAAVRGVVRLRHHPESDLGVPAGIFSGGGFRCAGVQVGRSRHGRSRARDAGQPLPCVLRRQPAACDAGDLLRFESLGDAGRGRRGGWRIRRFQFRHRLCAAALDRNLRPADHVRGTGDPGAARRRAVLDRRPHRASCDSLACQPARGFYFCRLTRQERTSGLQRAKVTHEKREDDMVRFLTAFSSVMIWMALAVAPAAAADKVVLMLNWYVYGEHAPFYYGKAKGIYAAENIDLEIQEGRGSAATPQAVAAKTADFGYVDVPTMMRAAVKGAPVVATGVLLQTTPMSAMGFADKNIRKPDDIRGKTVAITPADSMTQIWPLFLKKTGLKEGDFTTVAGDGQTKLNAVINGQADLLLGYVMDQSMKIKDATGKDVYRIKFADNGISMVSYAMLANTDYVKANADLVKRFMSATTKAVEAAEKDANGAAQAILDANPKGGKIDTLMQGFDLTIPLYRTPETKGKRPFQVTDQNMTDTVNLLVEYGGLRANAKENPQACYTTDLIPKGNS